MMSFEHVVTVLVKTPSGTVTRSSTFSSSEQVEFDEDVTVGTDRQINAAIDVSAVKSFWMVSDRTVTVETNDGAAPDDTFTLTAGVPYYWNTDSYDAFELTVDVTAFFITNAAAGVAHVQCRVVQDSTP